MARNRKAKKKQIKFDWLRALPWAAMVRLSVTAMSLLLVTFFGYRLLDRPIEHIHFDAPLQRVTKVELEGQARHYLNGGFISADLKGLQKSLQALDWVDRVSIQRRWPNQLVLHVREQKAAARWGESGLLNVRGELFVEQAQHIPAELPQLVGPKNTEWQVAQRYLELRDELLRHGLQIAVLALDERGAWSLTLGSGLEVKLGKEKIDRVVSRFLTVVAPMLAARADDIDYVDMRYSNGFAVRRAEKTIQLALEGMPNRG